MTTTDTPLAEQVHLRAGTLLLEPCERFIATTLLADCTNQKVHPNGSITVTLLHPDTLSSTEVRLWQLLYDITMGTLNGLADHGDGRHRHAVADLVENVMYGPVPARTSTAPDPTRSLEERDPAELGEFVDDHLILALTAADMLHHGDRQLAEDYARDRIAAVSDSWQTPAELVAEDGRRKTARLRAVLGL